MPSAFPVPVASPASACSPPLSRTPSAPTSRRVCPLLEQESPAVRLADAPQPWDLRQCTESGFVFLANPPAQEQFREEFAWEKTHVLESLDRRQREPVVYAMSQAVKRFRHRVLRRDKVAAVVGALVRERCDQTIRLVDIGCAAGDLLERLVARVPASTARRIEPIGIEISTQLAARADAALRRRGGRCIHATGADGLAQLPADSVDIVVLSCILEHEIAPLPLLRACRERLARDGRIVVKVPNYDCVSRWLRGSRWCGYRWPDHVNYFTPRTLAAMAERAGLRVVRMNVADRWPLSDSLYAIFGRAVPGAVPRDAG
jgi:SAM-dependent methyltransferase